MAKAFKDSQKKLFYSFPELLKWQRNTPDANKWRLKYYKGLGTSTSEEAKEYFSDMTRHLIKFRYNGEEDDDSIVLAFSKTKVDERKEWLKVWLKDCKSSRESEMDEECLYKEGETFISFKDFINKDLIQYSYLDSVRSIPCMMDGFKPGQRKVLFACLKRNLLKELKVAQLAGSVAELSAYHHGEASLASTIINLGQDFIGSNNINLLMPNGHFGTRLAGGKDSASPRYIDTQLNKVTKLIFNHDDEAALKYLLDDNQHIEPEWYAPIIPMVLINGCDGIGTGWNTKIPNFNPEKVIDNLKRMINGETPVKMHPWYRNFTGTIVEVRENKYVVNGEINQLVGGTTLEITELPVRVWTNSYKENVMEVYLHGNDKTPELITDYKEYNTDKTVRFVVEMKPTKYAEAEAMGFHKFFKLQAPLTLNNMILFDECGVIRKYNNETEILDNFFEVRLEMYVKRKNYLLGKLSAEVSKLKNQARFIKDEISGKFVSEKGKIAVLNEKLVAGNYDSDPVKAWQKSVEKLLPDDNDEDNDADKPDYAYLFQMQILDFLTEKEGALLEERDEKLKELDILENKSPEQMWLGDLEVLEKEIKTFYNEDTSEPREIASSVVKKPGKRGGKAIKIAAETAPSQISIRIEPKIDEKYLKKLSTEAEKKKKKTETQKQKQITAKENGDIVINSPDVIDSTCYEEAPLAQRLSSANSSEACKDLVRKVKQPVTTKELNKLKSNKKRNASPNKKKKKEIWESDSDEDKNDDLEDDVDGARDFDLIPRETVLKRNAAKNVKYNLNDDDDEEVNKEENSSKSSSSIDDLYDPSPEPSITSKVNTQPVLIDKKTFVPNIDFSMDSEISKPLKRKDKPAAKIPKVDSKAKKVNIPRKQIDSGDEADSIFKPGCLNQEEALKDDDSDFDFIAEKRTATNKKARIISSDSD